MYITLYLRNSPG